MYIDNESHICDVYYQTCLNLFITQEQTNLLIQCHIFNFYMLLMLWPIEHQIYHRGYLNCSHAQNAERIWACYFFGDQQVMHLFCKHCNEYCWEKLLYFPHDSFAYCLTVLSIQFISLSFSKSMLPMFWLYH